MIQALKWIATAMFLTAGTLLSLNIAISKIGFILFFTGHIILFFLFLRLKDNPMIVQNGFFILIDSIGIYRWWF
tara:strand:- start:321 stop:542 length:222 start_codon:yes stop_codon:yes gene_type:complete